MNQRSFKFLHFRLLLGLVCLHSAVSCVRTNPYYTTQAPGGGSYVAMAPQRWRFTPFGMVKMPQVPNFQKLKTSVLGDGSYWQGDGVRGRPRIHLVLSEQWAYFYKGNQLVGESPICSGSPAFPTPRGSFTIIEKDADHLSSVYGDYINNYGGIVMTQIDNRKDRRPPGTKFDGAKMYWFMRITGGVGMHQGYMPGYADSHGCIRLPANMAQTFYANAPLGTPVKITE